MITTILCKVIRNFLLLQRKLVSLQKIFDTNIIRMIDIESYIQLKAFARQDGALLSLVLIASFACMIYTPELPWCNILALSTPFFVGWRLVKFRNYALEGAISLRRGYAYAVFTYLYASLIFALAQYLYFRFLDNGVFLSMLTNAMNIIAQAYKDSGLTKEMMSENINMMSTMTPIQWTFMFLMQNIMIAIVISLPIAAICSRRSGKTTNIKQRHNS